MLVDQQVPRQPGVAQFELEGGIDCSPFEALLGMTIEQAAHGQALLTMPFNVMLSNGGGVNCEQERLTFLPRRGYKSVHI